jgi:hypothetical protein
VRAGNSPGVTRSASAASRVRISQGTFARNSLDTADARPYCTFGNNFQHADIPRALHVRAAAEFHRINALMAFFETANGKHAYFFAIFFTKHGQCTCLDRLIRREDARDCVFIGADALIHDVFHLFDFLGLQRIRMADIEAKTVRCHQRALLAHMLTQGTAQRLMQQMRG